jgi:hypothetical protein
MERNYLLLRMYWEEKAVLRTLLVLLKLPKQVVVTKPSKLLKQLLMAILLQPQHGQRILNGLPNF